MPGLPELEDRVEVLEGQVKTLEDQREFDRQVINSMNEVLVQVFNAVIQLGFRGEDHEERIQTLEDLTE